MYPFAHSHIFHFLHLSPVWFFFPPTSHHNSLSPGPGRLVLGYTHTPCRIPVTHSVHPLILPCVPELTRFTPSRPSSPPSKSLRRLWTHTPHQTSQLDFLSKPTGAASLYGLLTLFSFYRVQDLLLFSSGPTTFTHSP